MKKYLDVVEELFSTIDIRDKMAPDLSNLQAGSALYLPFLRKYLSEFERALQAIDPDVVLPYWDWPSDSQVLGRLSPIFTDDFLGGNGGPEPTVVNGQFAHWSVFYPQRHVLQRDWRLQGFCSFSFTRADKLAYIDQILLS